jgi:uncharacterized membrane protein YjdF
MVAYLVIFFISALVVENYEFASYIVFYFFGLILINLTSAQFLKRFQLTYFAVSMFLVFHIMGGIVHLGGIRLYDTYLFGIRYDWIIHYIGGVLCAMIAYDLLNFSSSRQYESDFLLFILLILIGAGISSLNEILEYGAVVFLNAAKAVGDYYNNALDLLNNTLGAATGAFLIIYFKNAKKSRKIGK